MPARPARRRTGGRRGADHPARRDRKRSPARHRTRPDPGHHHGPGRPRRPPGQSAEWAADRVPGYMTMAEAVAQRALDAAVSSRFRVFKPARRASRRPAASRPCAGGSGREAAARSPRRSRPRCSATASRTASSAGVVRSRVVIAVPDGPAAGFTPRHSRNRTEVTGTSCRKRHETCGNDTAQIPQQPGSGPRRSCPSCGLSSQRLWRGQLGAAGRDLQTGDD